MRTSAQSLRGTSVSLAMLAMLIAMPCALAQNYTVNINPTLNDLDIQIEPVASAGVLVLKLTNRTAQKIRCNIRYDAAPQPLERKTIYLDPGKVEQSAFAARRTWHSVDVGIECHEVEKK
jgi:hypothetical protein